ncbi:hypothetical protein D3C71_2012840 [compost metagenome]
MRDLKGGVIASEEAALQEFDGCSKAGVSIDRKFDDQAFNAPASTAAFRAWADS